MSIVAGDESGVPGVAVAKATELSARRLPSWGRRPAAADPSHPRDETRN